MPFEGLNSGIKYPRHTDMRFSEPIGGKFSNKSR